MVEDLGKLLKPFAERQQAFIEELNAHVEILSKQHNVTIQPQIGVVDLSTPAPQVEETKQDDKGKDTKGGE